MKVLHITTVHQRYDTRIFHRECINLSNITPITLLVSDGQGNEEVNNVKIIDVCSGVGRISRCKSIIAYLLKINDKNCTVLHLHDPEIYFFAIFFKILGFKVVLDIHEDYEKQILLKPYIPSTFLKKIISFSYGICEKILLNFVDFCVVPQPSFLKKNNSILVGNFMSNKEVIELNKVSIYKKERAFIYAGGISEERGLINMLVLAEQLKHHNISLKIAGSFQNKKLENQAKEHAGWNNVDYLGFLDRKQLLIEQKQCLAAIILFNNVGQYYLSYSVKLFEYTASQIPVIMPDFGEWISVNSEYGIGINVDVNNINDDDIDNVLKMSGDEDFLFRAKHFLEDHLLDENIARLYDRYLGLFNGNR
ncbi:glycosyltransferase [Vibrio crassostreae]|uniref:glycosyltransferase n=1 Tax=Vibrio crassostreae TaxID=246167 RepID=UPI00105376F3|nr:glycosyltransferase [Vibrio crassostreae]TCV26778.1 glycosyltransferase involved in cell wall biosynthesis [Vibrio crassostreae]